MGRKEAVVLALVEEIVYEMMMTIYLCVIFLEKWTSSCRHRLGRETYSIIKRIPDQTKHMNRLVRIGDDDCIANLRMDRNAFARLCFLLRQLGGLTDRKFVTVEEQVAMFLMTIAHHKKNKVVKFDFWRSRQTVSHHIHRVLRSILKLHFLFLVKPEPVTDYCTDPRWKWFKGCLGALDGKYIDVNVKTEDRPRFRTRKGSIAANVLAVCDRHMRFVYVLPGWEGSAADVRILRDSVNRVNGLWVPKGAYYLCDNGYANSDGFLAPFKGTRYHLNEWDAGNFRPQTPQEYFNMRHTRARNVIERAFGVLKMRWAILRSASYYPIKVQIRLIMACFLLHNFIRGEMLIDPYEQLLDSVNTNRAADEEHEEFIEVVQPSMAWNNFREVLTHEMWATWNHRV